MNRKELIKAAEAKYTISSLPWLKEREHKAIAHGVDAVLAALPAEPVRAPDLPPEHPEEYSQPQPDHLHDDGTVRATDPARAALAELVSLKDGPRDEHYWQSKDAAWGRARAALVAPPPEGEKP